MTREEGRDDELDRLLQSYEDEIYDLLAENEELRRLLDERPIDLGRWWHGIWTPPEEAA